MDLKDIKAIIDLMKKNSISEFETGEAGFQDQTQARSAMAALPSSSRTNPKCESLCAQSAAMAASGIAARPPLRAAFHGEAEIKSPMIGTFYRAPRRKPADYVEVGTEVNPETVVCIIEAMKVMNEIKAEAKGVITQVLVENAKPVEFGQPLFKIRPA